MMSKPIGRFSTESTQPQPEVHLGRDSGTIKEYDPPRHSYEAAGVGNARGSGSRVATLEEVVEERPEVRRQSMSSSYEHQHSRRVSSTISTPPATHQPENRVQMPESSGYRFVSSGAAFTPNPISVCRFCGMAVTPIITYEPNAMAYILCIICCIVFPLVGLICGVLILMGEGFREPRYTCPVCGAYMGVPYMIV